MSSKLKCAALVLSLMQLLAAAEFHPLDKNFERISNFSSAKGKPVTMPAAPEWNNNQEFTIAFWFKADKLPEMNYEKQMAGFAGLFSRRWNQDCRLSAGGIMGIQYLTPEGERYYRAQGVSIKPGQWYHFAATYSASKKTAAIYIDGYCESTVTGDKILPLKPLDKASLMLGHSETWNRFDGSLCAISIFDEAISPEQVAALAKNVPRGVVKKYPQLKVYHISPLSSEIINNSSSLPEKSAATRLTMVAAPGEYESAAFGFRCTEQPLQDLTFAVSDFTAKTGTSIPSSAMDLKLRKCWYQAGGCWVNIFQSSNVKELIPELLLNDDSLVIVDPVSRNQVLRYSYPEGTVYKSIINPDAYHGKSRFQMKLPVAEYPIRDAKSLQPFDLGEDFLQQMQLTLHVPEDTPPGDYLGNIAIRARGMNLSDLPVYVRVLPFKLAEPRTAYDLSRPFTPSVYYLSILRPDKDASLNPLQRSREQYLAELADLKAHGIDNPFCYQLLKWDMTLFRSALQLRKQAGMTNRPLFLHGPEQNMGIGLKSDEASLNTLRERIAAVMKIVKEELGHDDVYFYGVDEARDEKVKAQLPIWKVIHECGGKVFSSDESSNRSLCRQPGSAVDLVVAGWTSSKSLSAERHDNNGIIFMYFNPQGGVENPDIYRRNYGLKLWLDNYDGFATYCYYEAFGNPWDDFDCGMRDHNFVYPTADGVVDTIAWEGYREAVDDIRYATTLREAAAAARKSGDPAKVQLANTAEQWLQGIDAENADLDAVRTAIIRWILKLRQ